MTTNEIRYKFLNFFARKGHTIITSDSVVPKDDPTVLYTTAGMQQFKRQFLGHIDGYTRAATSQKCLRTDDLDKVGKTPCHHTFFEMLGNFSFGDYFKKDAIAWAWEFLTQEMKLSGDKLWVSVYEHDEEAYNEWIGRGFPKEKIVKLGDKDNFWPAEAQKNGPNGPCGPCSEIFFDYGVNSNCKSQKCDPSCNCGRFTEVWNLVFTQFNRKDGGILEPLPGKNIDTGMGLERLAAVVQGKTNNYEIDIFEPILKSINENLNAISSSEKLLIADHIRSITFAIADGVLPSNEGRGYVVKKLIIDVSDIAIRSGKNDPIIYKLVSAVVEAMKVPYPEIVAKAQNIADTIKNVEQGYIKIRSEKIPEFQEQALNIIDSKKMGDLIFIFRDTHGLTVSTIASVLGKLKISEDIVRGAWGEFSQLMEQQQNRSRASSKMTGERFADIELNLAGTQKTKFIGYEKMDGHAKILKIFLDDKEVAQVNVGDHVKIVLDQTPFYAESGGQVGDTGFLNAKNGKIQIVNTKKQDDIFIHFGVVEAGIADVEEAIEAKVDANRRLSIMRNHTATHLLQATLRKVLGTHVQQQGSLVAEDRLRFDFTHPKGLTQEQLAIIEYTINEHISHSDIVLKEDMTLEEAKKKGALAFFAEKYKENVRVITIGNYSKEFCGGTHLDSTGDINRFIISSEGAVAQGIRRLEAKTGYGALEFIKERDQKEKERLHLEIRRQQELKDKKDSDRRRLDDFRSNLKATLDSADSVNTTKIVVALIADADVNQLKDFCDLVKLQASSVAICFGSKANDSASLVVGISEDLIAKGIRANDLIKEIAPFINGSGGGRPQLAQAGSREVDKVDAALNQARKILKEKINL